MASFCHFTDSFLQWFELRGLHVQELRYCRWSSSSRIRLLFSTCLFHSYNFFVNLAALCYISNKVTFAFFFTAELKRKSKTKPPSVKSLFGTFLSFFLRVGILGPLINFNHFVHFSPPLYPYFRNFRCGAAYRAREPTLPVTFSSRFAEKPQCVFFIHPLSKNTSNLS